MCTNTLKYTQIHSTTFLSEDAVCKVAHCARVSDAYLKKVDKNAKKRKYLTNTDRYAQIRVNTAGNTFGKNSPRFREEFTPDPCNLITQSL